VVRRPSPSRAPRHWVPRRRTSFHAPRGTSCHGQPHGCAPGKARHWRRTTYGRGKTCGTHATRVVSRVGTGAVFGVLLTRLARP